MLMWSQKIVHFDFVSKLVLAKHGLTSGYWVGYDNRTGALTTSSGDLVSTAPGLHIIWGSGQPMPQSQCAMITQSGYG